MSSTEQVRALPNIAKACQLIALDNGGINRFRSVEQQAIDLERWIEDRAQFFYDLTAIDAWLGSLSEADLDTLCAGEDGEADVVLAGQAPEINDFLNDYFDEVC